MVHIKKMRRDIVSKHWITEMIMKYQIVSTQKYDLKVLAVLKAKHN